ncbi:MULTISPECIES: lantibiotic dehydratase [unclassified Streptomyces]|uniref:lantibiotic dehydratase n=1 Tax=unclassified Streptomyces TaxID=2593676 RepID=UPI000CD4A9B0|nr:MULTISPECIES: lantibiotic dehydratase [unclassified Streptomyces]
MYQHIDAAVLRATAWPPGRRITWWPDLTSEASGATTWHPWLEQTLRIPGFAAALEHASPVLARRARDICEGRQVAEPAARKVVLSVMRYALRASGRATPFGLFAGAVPIRFGATAAIRVGNEHRAVARPDSAWLTAVIERLEADPELQPHLEVQAADPVAERDGHLVREHRPAGSGGGTPVHVTIRASTPVRSAMDAAREPIRLKYLAAKLSADFPDAPHGTVTRLLSDLIAQQFLVTNLRASSLATDSLHHLLAVLTSAKADEMATVTDTVARLREVADGLTHHNTAASPTLARETRERLKTAMRPISPATEPTLAIDLRLAAEVTLPGSVVAEAERAASALVRLSGRTALSTAWTTWHGRFLERYGPRALVPLLDAVDAGTGLGYPAGFLGGPPSPQRSTLTERDTKLLALAQNAALRRIPEVALDDAAIADLAVPGGKRHVQQSTELAARIHAPSPRALDAGEFTLAITGVSRRAGTMAGRFLDLFPPVDRERMAKAYRAAPPATASALPVQLSAPPLYASTQNVARSPAVLPAVLALNEFQHQGAVTRVRLSDIAVTADVRRLYLISLPLRRPLEFAKLDAVEAVHRVHPLVRFLTEATEALNTPCTTFDWGAATELPFLPALWYGRTILSPARWLLTAADIADREANWPAWHRSLDAWRAEVGAPSTVYVGEGDQRIRLDLTEPAHRAVLRTQLERTGRAMLRADAAADAGWLGGRVHEVVIPLAATGAPPPAPNWLNGNDPVRRDHGRPPGCDGRFLIKLYSDPSRHNVILSRLPALLSEFDEAQWWFLPYRDPQDHLRLRLNVPAEQSATAVTTTATWTEQLRRAGLVGRVQWDTDFPETARFGGHSAINAAEAYFAADSEAAVSQRRSSADTNGPHPQAWTAASMLDLTIGMMGDPAAAMRWLIKHAPTTSPAPDRNLYDQAVALANPHDRRHRARQPGGEQITARWARRAETLATYRAALHTPGPANTATLLPELLHLHHTRAAGLDLDAERRCLHLARAAALSWTARGGRKP